MAISEELRATKHPMTGDITFSFKGQSLVLEEAAYYDLIDSSSEVAAKEFIRQQLSDEANRQNRGTTTYGKPPVTAYAPVTVYDEYYEKTTDERFEMSNKFLPFIVDKSTPIHIYTTLLSRSKGMNYGVVASIFRIVLVKGVEEVRKHAKELPEMALIKLYQEIISKYQNYRVSEFVLSDFMNIANYVGKTDIDLLSKEVNEAELSAKDLMVFLMVMAMVDKLPDVTELRFDHLLHENTVGRVLSEIPAYVSFSDTGFPMTFQSEIELRAYILYKALINQTDVDKPIAVKLVQLRKPQKKWVPGEDTKGEA